MRNAVGARRRIGAAARYPEDGKAVKRKFIGQNKNIIRPLSDDSTRLLIGTSVAGPVRRYDSDAESRAATPSVYWLSSRDEGNP